MPELYSEYDGLAEKQATPLHTTSGLTGSGMSRRRLGAEIAYAIFRANRPSGAKPEGGRLDPYCSRRARGANS
jgi:hypothetical protein